MSETLMRCDFRKKPSEMVIKATSNECKGRRRERVQASNENIPKLLGSVSGLFGISQLAFFCLIDPNIIKRLVINFSAA